ncbi:MAG TPA: D-glycerate dehydrogenase [Thermomicrobiales bacterium]|nr:D-glycerate dehydrogenase [Thermomicrobiales bacterium]
MTAKPLVAVTRDIPDAGLDILRASCEVRLWPEEMPPTPEELDGVLDGVVGALTLLDDKITAAVLDRHPQIRVVSNYAVGYDNIDVEAATARGVAVCNTPDVLNAATAEFSFALLMAAARRIVEASNYVKDGKWHTWGPRVLLGQNVVGATLGIVGFGRIGKELARMASGFNMRILAHARTVDPDAEREYGVTYVSLDELLAESDFVSLNVALTDETYHLIGARELALMKPTGILINAARGRVVDTDALLAALQDGTILAAGLDVSDPEPLPADHPLAHLPNCIVAPHIASATVEARTKMATMAARNLVAVLNGERPESIINPDVLDA